MIINNLKSWIKENENKINNLFLYSFKNPMKITEMYNDIDANGTGQSYRDLKNFLNSSHSDACLLYTSPSPRDGLLSRMPSSA